MANQEVVMKDGISPQANDAAPLPAGTDQRLPYVEPKVIIFGKLGALTHAVGNNGRTDGGIQFGLKHSGV
jgi:hypothetical protein